MECKRESDTDIVLFKPVWKIHHIVCWNFHKYVLSRIDQQQDMEVAALQQQHSGMVVGWQPEVLEMNLLGNFLVVASVLAVLLSVLAVLPSGYLKNGIEFNCKLHLYIVKLYTYAIKETNTWWYKVKTCQPTTKQLNHLLCAYFTYCLHANTYTSRLNQQP